MANALYEEIDRLKAVNKELLEACQAAAMFIRNGILLGFIRMPDIDCPDPAHNTEPMLAKAIANATGGKT